MSSQPQTQTQTPQSSLEPLIHHHFDPSTSTFTYLVACPSTLHAIIIDSVLDFDPATSRITTTTADSLLSLIRAQKYTIVKILETHVHADHLTASRYLQSKLAADADDAKNCGGNGGIRKPEICIGKRIVDVQRVFAEKYGIPQKEWEGAFDKVFEDEEEFKVGELVGRVKHLPGHTPDHVGYLVGCKFFSFLFPSRTGLLGFARKKGAARSLHACPLAISMNEVLTRPVKQQTSSAATHSLIPRLGLRGVISLVAMRMLCKFLFAFPSLSPSPHHPHPPLPSPLQPPS